MKIYSKNSYNTSFKGKIPLITDPDMAKGLRHIIDCRAGHLVERVTDRIKANPKGLNYLIDGEFPTKPSVIVDFLEGFKDMAKMPLAISANLSRFLHKKFPNVKLFDNIYSSKHVQNYFQDAALKNDVATLRGVYLNGKKFIDEIGKPSGDKCGCGQVKNHCENLSDKLDEALNDSMDFAKSQYDTKYERFITRLVSGFTAAGFLGKDFFNRAKMNGKDDETANKDKKEKVNQEVIANIGEAISQFAFLATFPVLANTKKWVTPLVSAGIGFTFNIVSRLIVGRPLSRIKMGEKALPKELRNTPIGIEEFKNQAKESSKKENKTDNNQNKKPLLSLKNILLVSAGSIAAGFALRYGKNKFIKTDMYKSLQDIFNNSKIGKALRNLKASEIENIYTDNKEIVSLCDTLTEVGEDSIGKKIKQNILEIIGEDEKTKLLIGKKYKTIKLFGRIEIPLYKIHKLPLAPFEFVKNVVAFPYQKAAQLAEGLNWIQKADKPKDLTDPYKIRNILTRYREYENRFGHDRELFVNKFRQYVQKTHESSLNTISSSKIENEKITVAAQVLGMLFGITFNMNDDYNKTVENGGTKIEAEKAARLRGLNKFTRTSIQAVIASTLNGTFAKQYNNSLIKAGLITATATVLTDIACRIVTGMPFKQMSKEEQISYKQEQEKGISGKYFSFIDRLAG